MQSNFYSDRDERGAPLETLIVSHFHSLGIPVGYNPASGTDDPSREDYDVYAGPQGQETFFEAKLDWASAFTGNIFVEEKSLRNSKADKFIYGRLLLNVFDRLRLLEMYEAREHGVHLFRHVVGGDQANNRGMLLPYKAVKENSQPLWMATRELTQRG